MSARENRADRRLPLACSLSEPQQARRREEVGKLFEGCLRVDELEAGYEFRFPGSAQWANRLTEFITFERGCCPFFAFELVFEPGEGPIRLRMRRLEGVKDLVAAFREMIDFVTRPETAEMLTSGGEAGAC